MGEGFLRSFGADAVSAGTEPAGQVHPLAIRVMAEIGIDLSRAEPKHVDLFLDQAFDHVITVCSGADAACPVFRGRIGKRVHIGFPDPAAAAGTEETRLETFRRIRDAIGERFRDYYEKEIQS